MILISGMRSLKVVGMVSQNQMGIFILIGLNLLLLELHLCSLELGVLRCFPVEDLNQGVRNEIIDIPLGFWRLMHGTRVDIMEQFVSF